MNGSGCRITLPKYNELNAYNKYNLNPANGNEIDLCSVPETCGCSADLEESWGTSNDCSSTACEAACDLVSNSDSDIAFLFYNGPEQEINATMDSDETVLTDNLDILKQHMNGQTQSASALKTASQLITDNEFAIKKSQKGIKLAWDVVKLYETVYGPYTINDKTKNGVYRKDNEVQANDGQDIDRAVVFLQQSILDVLYEDQSVIGSCFADLKGKYFKSAKKFPGYALPASFDIDNTYTFNINSVFREFWGLKINFASEPKRKPTGVYIPPGCIAKLTSSPEIINKGFQVEVGTVWTDHRQAAYKKIMYRNDRVRTNIEINETETYIANPNGGAVYIVVPYNIDMGMQEFTISGCAVESAYFYMNSLKSPLYVSDGTEKTSTTSEQEWDEMKKLNVPWVDLETDMFMMNVPLKWLENRSHESIVKLLSDYDLAIRGTNEMAGYEGEGYYRDKHTFYCQPDRQIKEVAYGVGYPQVNIEIQADENGPVNDPDHWMVHNVMYSHVMWHEHGHSLLHSDVWKQYEGETEAIVNFLTTYFEYIKFGKSLDQATADGLGNHIGADDAAIDWMVTQNFRDGKPMDITNSTKNEVRYQTRGYAKYIDIGRFLDFIVIRRFHRTWNAAWFKDKASSYTHYPSISSNDNRTLNLSIAAGVDVTPLIEFWGIFPDKAQELKAKIQEHGLKCSNELMKALKYYKTIIPQDAAAFKTFFADIYPDDQAQNNCASPDYGCGYYYAQLNNWNESSANAALDRLQTLIDNWYSYYEQQGIECIDFVQLEGCLFYTDDSTIGDLKCMLDQDYQVIEENQPTNPDPIPEDECVDSDSTDANGNGCAEYSNHPDWCGLYESEDFKSMQMCCACVGSIPEEEDNEEEGENGLCDDSDNGAVDVYGEGCVAYTENPDYCGGYDNDDFKSMEMCCVCKPQPEPEPIPEPKPEPATCEDSDNGATDAYGDGCDAYTENLDWCGGYDNDDFKSMEMCCVCKPQPEPATCEDSDNGAVDAYGTGCDAYTESPDWCGGYDSDEFDSMSMCCSCKTTQSPFNLINDSKNLPRPHGKPYHNNYRYNK